MHMYTSYPKLSQTVNHMICINFNSMIIGLVYIYVPFVSSAGYRCQNCYIIKSHGYTFGQSYRMHVP